MGGVLPFVLDYDSDDLDTLVERSWFANGVGAIGVGICLQGRIGIWDIGAKKQKNMELGQCGGWSLE